MPLHPWLFYYAYSAWCGREGVYIGDKDNYGIPASTATAVSTIQTNKKTNKTMKKPTIHKSSIARLAIVFLFCFAFSAQSEAYDGITYYGCNLSAKDRVNSAGKKLTSIRDILAQDRANVHKFGKRDRVDEIDRYCTTAAKRRIFQKARIKISKALLKRILSGKDSEVTVFILDKNTIDVQAGLPDPNVN